MRYILVVAAAVISDRVVKWLVASHMAVYESLPLAGDFFRLTYIRNTGAAFSMFSKHTWVLILLTAAMIAAGVLFLVIKIRKGSPAGLLMPVALIVGGGLGNLIDRICQGYVIDMFDLRGFAVFNVADIYVCLGCALLFIYVIFIMDRKDAAKQ
ncbi:MAG: signal peptidase II [Anaerovoracaceae bacterium]|jgi:signal peptidase II